MKTLSLCMIVRNEAEMLPGFLAAAHGLYDELCVVDTGSDDDTLAILKSAGAKVQQMPWQDDFSAPRNASLKMASCDFVLVLDADELVSPAFVAEARAMLGRAEVGAVSVNMVNTLPHGHRSRSQLPRMFLRDDSIHFAHRIHEDATPSIIEMLASRGLQLAHMSSEIEHLGYQQERALQRDKKNRDTSILWRCVGENPADLYSWFKLLEQGRFWADDDLSEEAAEGARKALDQLTSAPKEQKHFMGEMVVLLAMVLRKQDEDAAALLVHTWGERLPDDAALTLYRAQWREELGAVELAEQDYQHCLALKDTTHNLQLTTTRPHLGLARLAMARDQGDTALDLIDLAVREQPRDPEALLALASLSRMMGGKDAAARLANAYQQVYGDSAEMQAAWGEAAMLVGDHEEALHRLETACAMGHAAPAYEAMLAEARLAHELSGF